MGFSFMLARHEEHVPLVVDELLYFMAWPWGHEIILGLYSYCLLLKQPISEVSVNYLFILLIRKNDLSSDFIISVN